MPLKLNRLTIFSNTCHHLAIELELQLQARQGRSLHHKGDTKGLLNGGHCPASGAGISMGKDVPMCEEKKKEWYPARVFLCAYMIQDSKMLCSAVEASMRLHLQQQQPQGCCLNLKL
jgi:hypothetical protein